MPTESTQGSSAVELVRKLFKEVFEAGNLDVADEILTPDFTFAYPFSGFSPGAEGIKEFTRTFHDAFPGFKVEVHQLFGTEQDVAIRWTLQGEHQGDLLGIPASGKFVKLSAIGLYGIHRHHHQLSAGWLEMDTLGMLQQIGAVPPTNRLLPGLRK
jgi:steroid delta-isomerase-like uncharacterized protein